MKRRILWMLIVLLAMTATAGNVTPEQARWEALSFLRQTSTEGGVAGSRADVPDVSLSGRIAGLYVFNTTDDRGYVIVSDDDRTTPILGYSRSGRLELDRMPRNMRAWLQGYADEIAWLNKHGLQSSAKTAARRRTSAVKSPIAPLVQTRWNQGSPYNDNCPLYDDVNRAVTGCVATAMAQVLYYHRYAEMSGGIAAYTTDFCDAPCVPVGALEATSFDWDNMQMEYDGTETAEQKAAVAQLMQYCGASVGMNYGESSSSNTSEVVTALRDVFGYSTTVQLAIRSLCSYSEWIELIYHELSEGRPVVYGGQSSGGGHEFVCDGYQGEDFFHINWGWGGMSDNYFKLSALDSDQQGIGGSTSTDGYHYGQDAVIGIQKPDDTGNVAEDITFATPNLKANSISCADNIVTGQDIDITINITNKSVRDYSGDIWLGYYDGEYYYLQQGDVFEIPATETKDCVIRTAFGAAGTYQLLFFYPNIVGSYSTNAMVLKTIEVTDATPLVTTDNVELETDMPSVEHATLLGYNGDGDPVYNLYGNDFNGTLTITNNTESNYRGLFQLDLYDMKNYDCVGRAFSRITVPANGSTQLQINVRGLVAGKNYDLSYIYVKDGGYSDWVTSGLFMCKAAVIATDATGHTTVSLPNEPYEVPDAATAVDLTGTGVASVIKNSNPYTIYILGESDDVPEGLTNIVRGDGNGNYTAVTINLTDGNDFSTPVDFTAEDIVFDYAFTTGADGSNGWNTIMLPFDVTTVTADDTPIDWFHSGSDTGKQFWLKQFVGDGPGTVCFDYVSGGMEAYTPYIVAFPGNRWGEEYNLSTKAIRFRGQNAVVRSNNVMTSVTGGNYRFIGSTRQNVTSNIYGINAAGNKFELGNGSAPFRAYFKPGIFDPSMGTLSISSGDRTTDIGDGWQSTASDENEVTDLFGRRVKTPARGIYIKNGKKVIIRL